MIDWVLHSATEDQGMTWHQHSYLSDLNFSDDIAALTDNAHALQDLIDKIREHAGTLGLSIIAREMKNMLTGDHLPSTDILIKQQKVENFQEFT